jgi:hypothetical protein
MISWLAKSPAVATRATHPAQLIHPVTKESTGTHFFHATSNIVKPGRHMGILVVLTDCNNTS